MLFSPANGFVLFLTVISCNIGLSWASTGTGSGSSVPCVGTSVEFEEQTPTVLGISVEYGDSTPAAVGLGIGVERGNGGVDSVVKLWEISPVFMSRFS